MGETCINAKITVAQYNKVSVQGCTAKPTVSVRTGELSWKELIIEPETPTNVITHAKLARPIKSMCAIDGTYMDWEKVGGVRTYTYEDDGVTKISGTITFPFDVNDRIIFEHK